MRKLFLCTLLVAGMAMFSNSMYSPVLAQGAKDKDKKTKTVAPGTIEISEGKDGKFRFTIRNGEGKYLGISAAYASEKEAKAAVEELKEIVKTAKVSVKEKEKK